MGPPVVITPLQIVSTALVPIVCPVDKVPHLIPELTGFVGPSKRVTLAARIRIREFHS